MEPMMEELSKMKKELKLATEAEETSRHAMDDLAIVLQEVIAESTEAKQKLKATQSELKAFKVGKEQIRVKLVSTEEKLATALAERNEFRNAAERLMMETDETLADWNVKESGLVGCMKKVEEERSGLQADNLVLQEDMKKLRDILKQAMSEAIAAKEDSNLVRGENSKLKDQLAEKDTALNFISKELESLRLQLVESKSNVVSLPESKAHNVKFLQEIKPQKVRRKKIFRFDMGCSGRDKRHEDTVDEKARKVVVKEPPASVNMVNRVL